MGGHATGIFRRTAETVCGTTTAAKTTATSEGETAAPTTARWTAPTLSPTSSPRSFSTTAYNSKALAYGYQLPQTHNRSLALTCFAREDGNRTVDVVTAYEKLEQRFNLKSKVMMTSFHFFTVNSNKYCLLFFADYGKAIPSITVTANGTSFGKATEYLVVKDFWD